MSDAVPVRDTSDPPVPILRAFDWVATTLESFRERPLPGGYKTIMQPTFDVFGSSRVGDMRFSSVNGGIGVVEVLDDEVPDKKYRQYLSLAFQHDDAATGTHYMQAVRVIDFNGTFPFCPIDEPIQAAPNGVWFSSRGHTVPPGGRIGFRIFGTLSAGTQGFLRTQFVEFDVGEPNGSFT